MDEYKEYLYLRRPHYRDVDTGNITAQLAIREKLKCKPFKWFMEEVAFDLPKKYPMMEPPNVAEGEVLSLVVAKAFIFLHLLLLTSAHVFLQWPFRLKSLHASLIFLVNWITSPLVPVTGQNGIGQNGTDKMVATFIDSNSTELNSYSVITSHK